MKNLQLLAMIAISFCGSISMCSESRSEEPLPLIGKTFAARDSLNITVETNKDAQECLDGFAWRPSPFQVTVEKSKGQGDYLVRFPSPVPTGEAANDLVCMEWFIARDENGTPQSAPMIVVVHESGRRMEVGRLFARGLREMGCHTCMIHLPYYGERRNGQHPADAATLLKRVRQGVADTRRARDAVEVLPFVKGRISIQGTSLGGFVAALAAGIDDSFDRVHLLLAGGNLYEMMQNGRNETAKVKRELAEQGIVGEKLRELVYMMEPTRLAHRLDPKRTWLYSARFDTVVPLANAQALADAVPLVGEHHVQFPANHYSGVIFVPMVLKNIVKEAGVERTLE